MWEYYLVLDDFYNATFYDIGGSFMIKRIHKKKKKRTNILHIGAISLLLVPILFPSIYHSDTVEAATAKSWTFNATNPSGGPNGGTTNSITDGSATIANGIYNWVVPYDGNFSIQAKGANAFAGNYKGADIKGDINLIAGETIKILVGQAPLNSSAGAGGTYVARGSTPLIVGGGAGTRSNASLVNDSTPANYGYTYWSGSASGCLGGGSLTSSNGNGGAANYSGAGFTGNGNNGALSFINNGSGATTNGGFGGGGSNSSYSGGGGYSGGAGHYTYSRCTETYDSTNSQYVYQGDVSSSAGGSGGGSFNNGTNKVEVMRADTLNNNNGSVLITLISPGAELTTPIEGFQLQSKNITLAWNSVGANATKYEVVTEEKRPGDSVYRTPVVTNVGTNTSYAFTIPTGTPGNTLYRWKVIAYNGATPYNSISRNFTFSNIPPVLTGSFTTAQKDLSTSSNKQHMKFTVATLSDPDDYNYLKLYADIQEIAGSKKEFTNKINYPITWTSTEYKLKVIPNFTNKTFGLSIVDSATEATTLASLFTNRAMQATNAPAPETFTFNVYAQDHMNVGDGSLSTSNIIQQTITVDTRNYLPRMFNMTSDVNGRVMSTNQGFNRIKFSGKVDDLDPADIVKVHFTTKLKSDTVGGQYIVDPNIDKLVGSFNPTVSGVNASFNSTYTVPDNVTSGDYVLLIYGVDSRGGIGAPHIIDFKISQTNPVINFYATQSGNIISTAQRQVVAKDSKIKLYFTASNFTTLEYAGYHVTPDQQKASGTYTDLKIRGSFTNDIPSQFIGIDTSTYNKGDMFVFKFRATSSTGVKIEKDVRIIIKNDLTQLTDLADTKVPTAIRPSP